MIKFRIVSVDLYPPQFYFEILQKYFHSAEASERQPRWIIVISKDMDATAEYPSAAKTHNRLSLFLASSFENKI
jgi:hypothetical protein